MSSVDIESLIFSYFKEKDSGVEEAKKEVKKLISTCLKNDREDLASFVVSQLYPHEIREPYLRHAKKQGMKKCISFRSFLSERTAKRREGLYCPEWVLNKKEVAAKYVEKLGVSVPEIYGIFTTNELPDMDEVVLKPLRGAGSNGVFVIQGGVSFEVKSKKIYKGRHELLGRVKELGISKWILEEYIKPETSALCAPPVDLKFYSFYGKVGVVLEVIRHPENKYCFYGSSGEVVNVGQYENSLFVGNGFSQEDLEVVKKISSSIPAPFCRIDLLKGKDKTVFGEITPRPGSYENFNEEVDYLLGVEFLRAEERLLNDFLCGKRFNEIFIK
ncbi:ATP-grasp fold amidoligase family protein [Halomonas sp. AOP31-B1-25]|uniref:ATP-grasp fold amidoligase family protein n=1 Tax=Halomonas sp. AOP31-B1-25 TaxID=3457694 RepID=UPI004034A77C